MRMLSTYWPTKNLASDLFDEVDRFFTDMNRIAPASHYDERGFTPACEVSETADKYFVSFDLPGLRKEEIKVEMNNNILTVSGERKRETSHEDGGHVRRYEKLYGFFKRSFNLPSSIATDQVEARFENGVLELQLPKAEAAKPKLIEVQSAKK